MTLEQLKSKASALPLEPGVYLMRDLEHRVIYVGKAKKLKNRVSQYFQNTANHTPKTRLMVSKVFDFDIIVASSEFEALVLECAQIKRYQPKYNILLKDDKGYPYVRLDIRSDYPRLTLATRPDNDGALYFGPYGSRSMTQELINTLLQALKLPLCSRQFPRDMGKGRKCLHYHMGQCLGWCQMQDCQGAYKATAEQLRQLLAGNYSGVSAGLQEKMEQAAQELNFELAAALRDQLKAIRSLGQKQFVTAGSAYDIDAIGYGETQTKACFAVLHFSNGELVDKEFEICSREDGPSVVAALMKQYYLSRGIAPKMILLPFPVEDATAYQTLLREQFHKKVTIRVPQRGEHVRLVELACKNAVEEAQRITGREERNSAVSQLLGKMLSMDTPRRIESFDISNISGADNVASMVVFVDGKPSKKDYKRFKVDVGQQDDYQSMRQILSRRIEGYLEKKKGFDVLPDLWLIDGGQAHANVAQQVLRLYGLELAVFGMVKNDKHRTRGLITAQGEQIRIDNQQTVYSFIGTIQEETHRFAITYHRALRSKRLRYSQLDQIPGIGPKRKQALLKHFSSVSSISQASMEELLHVLPAQAAQAVYAHFHSTEG